METTFFAIPMAVDLQFEHFKALSGLENLPNDTGRVGMGFGSSQRDRKVVEIQQQQAPMILDLYNFDRLEPIDRRRLKEAPYLSLACDC